MIALDLKKKFSKLQRPITFIFSANQCIVLLFINTVNCAHGVHTDKAPEYHRLS